MHQPISRSLTKKARELFRRGEPIPEGYLRPEILESWQRSQSYGLEFDKADKRLISKEALAERIQERRELYNTATLVMERLYDFTAGSGCLTTLSDEEGYVLFAMGDEGIMEIARKNSFVEGCNRNERRLGTNGIGTPLVTNQPIQVFAEEHYYELHYNWVCSGAPILGTSGKPIGVFCVTALFDKVSFHTLGLAAAAADSITQQIAMKKAYDSITRIQQHTKTIVECVPTGILLCNSDLTVIMTNSRATGLLMLPETQIVGKKLHEPLGKESFSADSLPSILDGKHITIERNNVSHKFFFTLNISSTGDYVITFLKSDSLPKSEPRVIGSEAYFRFEDIVGQVPAMQNAVSLARIAADNDSTVLVTGESGTGKELFAQAIHNAGRRRHGPFVALNCAALPKSLIESELFGFESGTFTGARREGNAGKFELANGGTIFLDEIGDMSLDVQASLLRVLQSREVTRLGSSRATKIDVRIIAATNRNLLDAIEDSVFRTDLFYRLNVFSIHIPPLRDRASDIRLLADYFLRKYASLTARMVNGFTEEAYRAMEAHPWPGNIRELENVIERAIYVTTTPFIGLDSLLLRNVSPRMSARLRVMHPEPGPTASKADAALAAAFRSGESSEAVKKALQLTNGNMRRSAELLDVSLRTLYRRIAEMGLSPAALRRFAEE
ncbi:MAG: sigma 54-interacting transcriptional regulator [Planctomycetaceae bacterium]|nr:sigma 54-interacting transcriptional regulator [Planctomycetaceae bacterium]